MRRSWVLVTGASRGLGECIAKRFWGAGWNVVLVARSENDLQQVIGRLGEKRSQEALGLACDLSQNDQVSRLVLQIKAKLPRLDALINNAAIHGPIGPLVCNDLALWQEAISVNLLAPVVLCNGLIDLIDSSGGGSIINLSGGGATGPRPNFTAYASSKAALVRFSETLALEVESRGIRVNCIAPGAMNTGLLAEVVSSGVGSAGAREFDIAEKIGKEGGTSLNDVADLALFLTSKESDGITGKLISANWDLWSKWPEHVRELKDTDVYTLRRITGRDRGFSWGDR